LGPLETDEEKETNGDKDSGEPRPERILMEVLGVKRIDKDYLKLLKKEFQNIISQWTMNTIGENYFKKDGVMEQQDIAFI
jgi:hypothetical protein